MSTIQTVAMGIVGVAMATTLILPGRQTPAVLKAAEGLFSGSLKTAMGN